MQEEKRNDACPCFMSTVASKNLTDKDEQAAKINAKARKSQGAAVNMGKKEGSSPRNGNVVTISGVDEEQGLGEEKNTTIRDIAFHDIRFHDIPYQLVINEHILSHNTPSTKTTTQHNTCTLNSH